MNTQYPFDAALLLRKKKSLRRQLLTQTPLLEKRIAILGGSTTEEVADMLELCLLMRGIKPQFYQSAYQQYFSDALQPEPALQAFQPDLVYLHTSSMNIREYPSLASNAQDVDALFAQHMDHFSSVWQGINHHLQCPIIQNNFEEPFHRPLGNYDGSDYRGNSRFVARLNLAFAEAAQQQPALHIHDIHYLSARIGLDRWFNPRQWYLYKYAMDMEAIVHLAWQLAGVIASLFGASKKGLVLDLDNTLWGGVIGDDGVEGIAIGGNSAEAEAHSDLQRYALALKQRGILLAVCSKNDEANARSGFVHPDSILRQDDFSAFQANWENKPDNILAIANTLNIGVDSLVFVDDNPAERELVRQQLPAVTVPDIGNDISEFIRTLDHAALFEITSLSAEDLNRSQQYSENAQRQSLSNHFTDYADFLRTLEMRARIEAFSQCNLERITQLTNKTNQFNLTSKRYTLPDIKQMAESAQYITLAGQLTDRFGDNGLVSAIAGKIDGTHLHIELWLMSCRVLKRGLEDAMFTELCQQAVLKNINTLVGYYLPTAKNSMVAHLYRDFGFSLQSENNAQSVWHLSLPLTGKPVEHFIKTDHT